MLFAFILNLSVMLGNYLQQTTSADDISDAFFLGALRVKCNRGPSFSLLTVALTTTKNKIIIINLCSAEP